jgi:hypothetical protein
MCKLVADCEGSRGAMLAPPFMSRLDLGGGGSPE